MRSALYYVITVFIWGSTWTMIRYQSTEAVEVSVGLRYLLASVILFGICLLLKRKLRFDWTSHKKFLSLGFLLYFVNYIFSYSAVNNLPSGVVAVISSTLILMNLVNVWFFLGEKFSRPHLYSGLIALAGISLLFWNDILAMEGSYSAALGLSFALLSTYFASAGSILSSRIQKWGKAGILETNAFAMLYGAIASLAFALLSGKSFDIEFTLSYTLSLAYLAVFGSVIAFGSYLSLVGSLGPVRAAYIFIMFPVVALVFSTFLENYVWSAEKFIGVALVLLGNYLGIGRSRKVRAPTALRPVGGCGIPVAQARRR